MARKTKQDAVEFDIVNGNFDEHDGYDIEVSLQNKLRQQDTATAGKVSGIRVNNSTVSKDANGVVDLSIPTVDPSLNVESSNPVENGAVAVEINGLKTAKVGGMRTEDAGDGSNLTLVLENEQGDEIASCRIPKASEGGNQTYARVTAAVSKARIKQGDSVVLTWTYNHYNSDGTPTGQAAETVVIRVVNGTTETYRETLSNVADNTTRTLTLTPAMLTAGTVGVYVQATVVDGEGNQQKAQGYKSVNVVNINLSSSFDPASQLALSGGFTDAQQIDIPFTLTAPRGTSVTLWLDGVQYDTTTVNTSSTTVGHFYIPASSLSAGKHNVQMVAESDGLLSNVIYCDLLKAGGSTSYIGLKLILNADTLSQMPLGYESGSESAISIAVQQFTDISFAYAAWNASSVTSTIQVLINGVAAQTLTADRTQQTFTQRFDTSGNSTLALRLGNITRTLNVVVSAAEGIDEQEASDYVLKLSATGRSNSESNPADWGGVTTFRNVDWNTSGWLKKDGVDTLALSNGASAEISYKAFELTDQYSIQANGMTVEMEVMVSQVLERGATVVDCTDGSPKLGFDITTQQAALHLGQMQNIVTAETDEDTGEPIVITRELGVAMDIAPDKWMKVAFVIQPNSAGGRKTFLFINGVLSKANQYEQGVVLVQNTPKNIVFNSDKADVYVRSVRIYRRALSHTELLNNFIVDRPTAAQIQQKHESNATSAEGSNLTIDPQTLISKNRGVLVIIRTQDSGTGLTDVYNRNDKKADFIADYVHWYSPLGRAYDFEAYNVYIRIQGTSSTKYPWKNIRIYLTKGPFTSESPCKIICENVIYEQQYDAAKDKWKLVSSNGKEFKGYAMRGKDSSIEQAVLCAKTDFVDSSMVLNTGGGMLYDNTMRSLNLLTPPQTYDARVRQAIDGIPCDMFCGTSLTGELNYYGQYQLNNEKSKSGKIFGMEGVKDGNGDSVEWACPIALEALDNGSPMTLFQSAGVSGSTSLDNQLEAEFDRGFEFNFPEDTFWSATKITDATKESVASATQKTAIRRLMGWLYDVTPSAMRTNPDYGTREGWSDQSKAKWVSSRFKQEINQYFNINHLLCYYLFTDYHASVDQRAKNIIWRTWDGLIWYSTYYDGDTAHSLRNDAFMAYLYNVTRDTWDDERSKYAFEGHNSRLWCLVLANFENELREQAAALRGVMTLDYMLRVFNEIIMGNYSERQYNESGMLKYVDTMATQNYVYTLTGNREAHRTAFLTDRAALLDARYGTGNFQADYLGMRVGREDSDPTDNVVLKSGDLYYYGLKLANGTWRYGPERANEGDTVTVPVTGKLSSANDPLSLCGASQITEVNFTGMHGHLMGDLDLSRCVKLSKLNMNASGGVNRGVIMSLGNISKLEYVDLTGQISTGTNQAGTALDMSKQRKLKSLLCGGTSLQQVLLPEGAPISTLVLPSTTTWLSLRYLPNLTRAGLTLQSTENVRQFIFAECPNLNWQELLAECPNVEFIRIEGVTGKVRASFLEQYINKKGYDADGNPTTFPALTGKVFLTEVISAERLATLRDTFKYLDIVECQYSHYWFDDKVTDPANVTNEDNMTGLAYVTANTISTQAKPNGYEPSGHVALIRERSQLCSGLIWPSTHKMRVTKLSKDSLTQKADGTIFDPTDTNGEGFDVFMYLPKYFYKGVNDYKNARKHFFVSSGVEYIEDDKKKRRAPDPTGNTSRTALSQCLFVNGKAIDNRMFAAGDTIDESIMSVASECATYKVDVQDMKQARFPSMNHSYFGHAFTDANGVILSIENLSVYSANGNPADFMNSEGDYDFRDVPADAKWLYFTCLNTISQSLEAIVTDSTDIEAIEPDWVEHKAELIGVYQGHAAGITTGGTATSGLRSISGKVVSRGSGTSTQVNAWTYDANGNPTAMSNTRINGTAQDFFNLAGIRNVQTGVVNGEYSTVPYETSKDMANLLMCWFGTRDVETIVGRGSSAGETTGVRNAIAFGDSAYTAQNQHNKMWGLECWTASTYEWTDKGCLNAPSWTQFKREKRPASSAYVSDKYYNIMQQDGNERRVKAAETNQATNVARVRFGRYCDIVVGSYAGDTAYATCYAAYQSTNADKGRVLGRSVYNASASAGVAYSSTHSASSNSGTSLGGRLCFFGEIENEDVLTE